MCEDAKLGFAIGRIRAFAANMFFCVRGFVVCVRGGWGAVGGGGRGGGKLTLRHGVTIHGFVVCDVCSSIDCEGALGALVFEVCVPS
jgi:hypothetical protein